MIPSQRISTPWSPLSEELYDHRSDPKEWKNQAGNPELAELKTRLAGFIPTDPHPGLKVQDWYEEHQE